MSLQPFTLVTGKAAPMPRSISAAVRVGVTVSALRPRSEGGSSNAL